MAKRKSARGRTASRSNSTSKNTEVFEGGLDGDIQNGFAEAETTGRMIAVTLNAPTAAARKSMLSEVSNSCGLGGNKGSVCTSSDFGNDGIDEEQADQAEVVMLEDLGIALLNGDVDQNAAASMAASESSDGIIMEPEYVNYPMGFDESSEQTEFGLDDEFEQSVSKASTSQDVNIELARTMIKLLDRILDADGLNGAAEAADAEAAATCFSDTSSSTWGLKATNVSNSPLTGEGIRIAVLDTGMDLGHPDFSGRNIRHAVFQTAPGDTQIHDMSGHGTHCIGTACGPPRSNFGPRYGVASQSDIFAGKVLALNRNTGRASGGDFAILRGIQWALSNRCQIVSMSLGARAGNSFPQSYEQAARRALRQGSLIVAATGNDSRRSRGFVAPVGRPANCPSILGVAAVDRCMRIADFSNGRRHLHAGAEVNISGPGVRVFSSIPRQQGSVGFKSGTSMATPHISGIAALIAQQTGLRGVPLYRELRRRARRLGNFNDFGNGLGRA